MRARLTAVSSQSRTLDESPEKGEAMRRRIAVAVALVALLASVGAGIVVAGARGDSEVPITGTALVRASDAALAATGGGTVTETEVGDEEGYYEVEVTLSDGRQVDVHLDQGFTVLGSQPDAEEPNDRDDAGS
jgi:hypothetical protein